jgi:hypothetical protein
MNERDISKEMGEFSTFLHQMWTHWVALMSGIVSVILGAAQRLRKKDISSNLFWLLALCLMLFSAFQAWQDQYHKHPAAKRSNLIRFVNQVRVDVRLALEDGADAPVKLQLKTGPANQNIVKVLPDVRPGEVTLDFSGLETNTYYLFLSSTGYAARWVAVNIQDNAVSLIPTNANITLYRKRYVTIRYAVNTAGNRQLYGANVEEGVCVASHWGMVPHFGGDWQVWQRQSKSGFFGVEP